MPAPLLHTLHAPVRQASVRAHNLALVLRHVSDSVGPMSRASLAAATGLTRATVSTLVDDLIAGSLIIELEPPPRAGAGRPAVRLAVAPNGPAGLGLEINVDYLAACVMDLTSTVRHRIVEHADQRPLGAHGSLAAVARLAHHVRSLAEADGLRLAGAALAVPGLVSAHGLIRRAPNLDWRDVDAPDVLRQARALRDLPVTVDNEANLAALGESGATAGSTASFVYVSGEIGIGAGIVLDGVLYRGTRGFSGELGHIPVDRQGPHCRCGARGCLETYAGLEAILTAARIPAQRRPEDTLQLLVTRAAGADAIALAALADAGRAVGGAVATVINLLDVDNVVFGGSYAQLLPWLREGIDREIAQRVLTAGWAPVTLRAATLGADAAMVGAAGAVIGGVHANPASWLAAQSA